MPINLDLETLNSLTTTAETIAPAIKSEGVGDTFEQRALYWINTANSLFSSLNQLYDNLKSNPLVAKQLSDRLGFKFPSGDGGGIPSSVQTPIQSQAPLTGSISKIKDSPILIFMQRFFSYLINAGFGKNTINQLYKQMLKKIEGSGMGDTTIEEVYKHLLEDKEFLNEILKKFGNDKK